MFKLKELAQFPSTSDATSSVLKTDPIFTHPPSTLKDPGPSGAYSAKDTKRHLPAEKATTQNWIHLISSTMSNIKILPVIGGSLRWTSRSDDSMWRHTVMTMSRFRAAQDKATWTELSRIHGYSLRHGSSGSNRSPRLLLNTSRNSAEWDYSCYEGAARGSQNIPSTRGRVGEAPLHTWMPASIMTTSVADRSQAPSLPQPDTQ
jgi:hypothetical protein